ncbi:MAG: Ig-like domain-containing protein, partial [Bacteroidota bacterium]
PLRKVRYYRLFGIFDTPEKTKTPIRIGRSGDDLFQFRGEIDYVRILSAPNGTPALDENNLLLNSLDLSSDVLVSEITVSSAEGNTITVENTSQMSATVLPENATDPTFDWSVVNGTGEATIDQNGLLTSVSEGIVTVEAIANDASGVKGELEITIEAKPDVLVTEISVSSANGINIVLGQTSQMSAVVLPADATDATFTWNVVNGSGEATIDETGLLTTISAGLVTVEAIANDASGVKGTLEINIQTEAVLVTEITISSAEGNTISVGQSSQMSAVVSPSDASDQSFTWSVTNGTGEATIDDGGLLTTVSVGTVTVEATASDASGVVGTLQITIEEVLVTEITVSSAEGTSIAIGQTSQMSAVVLPSDATDATFTWGVVNGTGEATIDQNGLLTAVAAGTITVEATANDASGITGTLDVTIEDILVSEITITSAEGITITEGETSQMSAVVLPQDATDATFTWGVVNGTGEATIDQKGLLTAVSEGTVSVEATANDASGVKGTLELTIEPDVILVTSITVTSASGNTITEGQTLQMSAAVLPENSTDATVTWGVVNGTGEAIIDANGLLTAVAAGLVTVEATANDASGVKGAFEIIVNEVLVTEIVVNSAEGTTVIVGGTSQMNATVLPQNANDLSFEWSVMNGTGEATIDQMGLFTATSVGSVTVQATANDGSAVAGSLEITIDPLPLSIAEGNEIRVYPNPVTNKLFIDNYRFGTIEMIDSSGKRFGKEVIAGQVNISDMRDGIYLINLLDKNEMIRIIITH